MAVCYALSSATELLTVLFDRILSAPLVPDGRREWCSLDT
jgi:hypothetical protein